MIDAPLAPMIDHVMITHGDKRNDPFYWLRDRDNPAVIEYIQQENEYFDQIMQPLAGFRQSLYQEMKSRIKEDDSSPPFKERNYYYYKRYEANLEYPFYCRKYQDLKNPEQVYLDANVLATGHDYFSVGNIDFSENEQRLAYSYDTQGRRIYTIIIEDTITKKVYDTLTNTTGDFVWANNNDTLFYTKQDPETLRAHQVWRHTIGARQKDDILVYEELDDTFSLDLGKTQSRAWILISAHQTITSEYKLISADKPEAPLQTFLPRQRGHEYYLDHLNHQFYVISNDKAPNFRLLVAQDDNYAQLQWKELVPASKEALLEDIVLYDTHMVLQQRINGLTQFKVLDYQTPHQTNYLIDMPDESYAAWFDINVDPTRPKLRFQYNSMAQPNLTIEFDLIQKTKTVLKTQPVLGDFSAERYQVERHWAPAKDGILIPISLVYHKSFPPEPKRPLLLYGYGAYGISLEARFSSERLSLLDRGVSFAIAHVRGGEELGRPWYEGGRLLHKENSFDDFIACAEYLIKKDYTRPEKLMAMGGSAGGLLMGAVMNKRPELFSAAIAAVPFVDVVTTMLDKEIPLTTGEFDEWGNPEDKRYYQYMLKYSPYDNVQKKAYPHLLVTTGLHDSQVQYWEPAKWVAKLRRYKTNDNVVLLKTNVKAGHQGASGRFEYLYEIADEYAFLLGIQDLVPEAQLQAKGKDLHE